MNIAFIPVYVRYLGVEAYGLIGVFALLQAWSTLLDAGLRPALGREMVRYSAGTRDIQSTRNLLRSVEVLASGVAIAIAGIGVLACGQLARAWLSNTTMPEPVIARSLALMSVVLGLRFIESIYISVLVGLQKQVLESGLTAAVATVRGLGAILALMWVSPNITVFFGWQVLLSVVSVGFYAVAVHTSLPKAAVRAVFSKLELRQVAHFAAGMTGITCLALLLTQIDKVLLSRMLSLKDFGYYVLAGTMAAALNSLLIPVTAAFYPVFTELATLRDFHRMKATYHRGCQLVSVVVGSAAVILIVFSYDVVLLWTHDGGLAARVNLMMRILTFGSLLNMLISMPYNLQVAHGWTSLSLWINSAAVCLLLPALLVVVPRFGVLGASWVWVALNVGLLAANTYAMHRRILSGEMGHWYAYDVILPLGAAAAVALLTNFWIPQAHTSLLETVRLMGCGICIVVAAAMAAPATRDALLRLIRGKARSWAHI
jgi:O-antigen/teichoic acid export membrane protein